MARAEAQEWASLTAPAPFKTLVKSRPLTSWLKQVTWQSTKSPISSCPFYLWYIFEIHLLFISLSCCCNSGSSPRQLSSGWLQSPPRSSPSLPRSFPMYSSHYERVCRNSNLSKMQIQCFSPLEAHYWIFNIYSVRLKPLGMVGKAHWWSTSASDSDFQIFTLLFLLPGLPFPTANTATPTPTHGHEPISLQEPAPPLKTVLSTCISRAVHPSHRFFLLSHYQHQSMTHRFAQGVMVQHRRSRS